ncbi:hypothetical protein [Leptodesmis sp.]|uniref:hypothetical protein n=1 Tax=Leptodesmis sp. TaxID=3100501 RepID=UPI0040534EEF
MNSNPQPAFSGGGNIALKIPRFRFAETVVFYRDTLRLPHLGQRDTSYVFQFGTMRLWLDEVPHYSQTDVWLELSTNDLEEAVDYLTASQTPIRDELAPLGDFRGHWIFDPAGVVHLLSQHEEMQTV